jgi:hypothetical protein
LRFFRGAEGADLELLALAEAQNDEVVRFFGGRAVRRHLARRLRLDRRRDLRRDRRSLDDGFCNRRLDRLEWRGSGPRGERRLDGERLDHRRGLGGGRSHDGRLGGRSGRGLLDGLDERLSLNRRDLDDRRRRERLRRGSSRDRLG